jgi:hypothetical protein
MSTLRCSLLAAAPFLLFVLVGCGGGDNREGLSGTVTLNGKNLDRGVITFVSEGNSPTQASAVVENGQYAIPQPQGLAPGKYKVSISSPDGKTPDADPNAAPGPSGNFASKDRIPAKFNIQSKLEVEVKKGDPNKFDFSIP